MHIRNNHKEDISVAAMIEMNTQYSLQIFFAKETILPIAVLMFPRSL